MVQPRRGLPNQLRRLLDLLLRQRPIPVLECVAHPGEVGRLVAGPNLWRGEDVLVLRPAGELGVLGDILALGEVLKEISKEPERTTYPTAVLQVKEISLEVARAEVMAYAADGLHL